jgi:hypothetical protein
VYRYFAYRRLAKVAGCPAARTVPISHCPEARWRTNPGAVATPSRAALMRGDRAAISDADGHTGGGKGISSGPHEEYHDHETAPFDRYGILFGNKGPMLHERDRRFESVSLRRRARPGNGIRAVDPSAG